MTSPTEGPKGKKWEKFRRYFANQYMTIDARSLGFGRIILSIILMVDLLRRTEREVREPAKRR